MRWEIAFARQTLMRPVQLEICCFGDATLRWSWGEDVSGRLWLHDKGDAGPIGAA